MNTRIRKMICMAFLFVTAAGIGLLAQPALGTPGTSLEALGETKRHLVWDELDQVYHCVGSPLDCMTNAIQ